MNYKYQHAFNIIHDTILKARDQITQKDTVERLDSMEKRANELMEKYPIKPENKFYYILGKCTKQNQFYLNNHPTSLSKL